MQRDINVCRTTDMSRIHACVHLLLYKVSLHTMMPHTLFHTQKVDYINIIINDLLLGLKIFQLTTSMI